MGSQGAAVAVINTTFAIVSHWGTFI